MRQIIYLLTSLFIFTSCNNNSQSNDRKQSPDTTETIVEEEIGPDTKKLREDLILSYAKPIEFESDFKGKNGKKGKVYGKYYCLFDSAIILPGKYVWEDTSKPFTTHNFAENIAIIINNDTVVKKTITKEIFFSILDTTLTKYAVILEPEFEGYEDKEDEFDFRFSISIPVTDVGIGRKLSLKRNGKVRISDLE